MKFVAARGAGLSDAEDAAQTVFTGMFARGAEVQNPRAYLYQAVKNEVAALARRQRSDLDTALRSVGSRVERSAAEDVYHQGEVGIVWDSLAILPPRQREVMARVYAGYQVNDIAEAFGISTSTVRSNLRHGRGTLRPFFVGDGQHLHWRAGQRLYEAWQRGGTLPITPRPVIGWAWDQAKALGVDPEHGAAWRGRGEAPPPRILARSLFMGTGCAGRAWEDHRADEGRGRCRRRGAVAGRRAGGR